MPSNSRHSLTRWFTGAAVVTLLIGLFGCLEEEAVDTPKLLRPVKSTMVTVDSGGQDYSFSGLLHSTREVSLSFRVSGRLDRLDVRVGDVVKRGDVLAIIDPTDFVLEVERADAALSEREAAFRNARTSYLRVERLYEAGNTARSALDNARAEFEAADAAVQAAQKALEIARTNRSYTALRAEDDCAIAATDVEVGENVATGQQVIFAACGNELEVKLNIPESLIGQISKAMPVAVTFSAIEGRTFAGRVSEVGVAPVGGGTTFPVDILITGDDRRGLKAGLSADVVFSIAAPGTSTISVPPFAVAEDRDGRFVYLIESTGDGVAVVRRHGVETGSILPGGIEIVAGLAPGMRVVTAGVSFLRDGMEVQFDDR